MSMRKKAARPTRAPRPRAARPTAARPTAARPARHEPPSNNPIDIGGGSLIIPPKPKSRGKKK
jgi:hypothetical protein